MMKLRLPLRLAPGFDHHTDMVSLEQAANLNLLLDQVLRSGVDGDIVELGCYIGSTSCIIGSTLAASGDPRRFHVFDRFDVALGEHPAGRDVFERNLREAGVPMPVIHQGDVFETVPAALPSRIAFAHLDLGVGGDTQLHARLMDHALRHVYDRLSPGAILVLMDYYVPGLTVEGHDSNPGVRKAADLFFRDKPDAVITLFGGPCAHAYVRKEG
jgi:O-methyltransferase